MKRTLLILAVLVFSAGCATIYDPVSRREVRTLFSESREIELGRQISNRIEEEAGICGESTETLQEIGLRVAGHSERPHLDYSFKVLESDEINAFALPGGFIYMYRGLMDILDEDEIAAVLGHEIAHVVARHGVKRLQAVYGYQLLSIAGLIAMRDKVDPAAAQELSDAVFTLVLLGYSRRDELEADRLGTRYAIEAGFAPDGMLRVLEKFEEMQRGAPVISFLSTHPHPRDRMKEVRIVIDSIETDGPAE